MLPILFHIGGVSIHTYGLLVGLALFGSTGAAVWLGQREGISADWLWDLALIIIFGAVVGGRLEYVRTHWDLFSGDPAKIFALRDGGLVFYGGFVLTVATMIGYLQWRKLPMMRVLDLYAPLVPLGHALGRIGCLAAGCCFGRPTDLPWGIVFPPGTAAPHGVPLHPTQLYEAATNTLLGAALMWQYQRKQARIRAGASVPHGRVFGLLLTGYAVTRILNEQLRGDLERGIALAGLTNAQVTGLALGTIGLAILALTQSKGR